MDRNSNKNRGTTLVEMLVIIGIISILVTLIVPSLGVARLQAKRVVCANNLHDIGVVTQLYVDSHNGHFPQLFYYFEPGASDTIVILVVPKKAAVAGWTNYDPKSFICPSDDSPKSISVRQPDDSLVSYQVSYGYNVDLLLRDMTIYDLLPNPSNIVLFFDGMEDGKGKRQGHYDCTFDFANDSMAYRHLSKANVLFVDGHVEFRTNIMISEIISGQDPIGTGHGAHSEPDKKKITPDTAGKKKD